MIAALPPGTIIAAMIGRARRRIADYFVVQHALAPDEAVPYAPTRPIEKRQFNRMIAQGLIREAEPGRYWLDRPAFRIAEDRRHRHMAVVAGVMAVVAALALLLFYKR
jgi:hypothetical protein